MINSLEYQIVPDFYSSIEECVEFKYKKVQTNPRYKHFKQTHFTAGDEQQFQEYRNQINNSFNMKGCVNLKNIFKDSILYKPWDGYTNINAISVTNTFRYLFHKFKKSIFIKIKDNKLSVFLPFSKEKYVNEWSNKINIDPSSGYKSIAEFMKHVSELEGMSRFFSEKKINAFVDTWYSNNCLIRSEFPTAEGDSGVTQACNMLKELCEKRKIPDMEFFINRRDFPLLKRNRTEPYHNIYGNETTPLLSHNYDKYLPILSNVTNENYADIAIPTWEDWSRVQSFEGKYFVDNPRSYTYNFDKPWEERKNIAVFRGSSTGCGVTIDTNPRLKVSYMSTLVENKSYIDAGITKWNLRPRKVMNSKYLQTIEKNDLPFGLIESMNPEKQCEYKYIINIDGHVSAFRLSLELSMGSVILLVSSQWKMWFSYLLVPNKHFVPVKDDLSDLIDQIKWCQNNDEKCKDIAKNAKIFYKTYLSKDGILDYLQKIICNIKFQVGYYVYNYKSPLQIQLDNEKTQLLTRYFPKPKLYVDINVCPNQPRSFGILKGLEYITSMLLENDPEYLKKLENTSILLAQTKTSTINECKLASYDIVIKKTIKITETIHEAFIGIKCINEIIKDIPNFAYTFGISFGEELFLISEKIDGDVFTKYLESRDFKIKEYLFILIQISLALQVAQKSCDFVHWDLYSWNIIIQKLPSLKTIDYNVGSQNNPKIIRIQTNIVPIIIDYGKSHAVFNKEKYGFIHMYKTTTVQDIVTVVISSVYKLLLNDKLANKLSRKDHTIILELCNFFTNTEYRKKSFKNIGELLHFLHTHHSYAELISSNKYDLEQKTPIDFINHIMNIIDNLDIKIVENIEFSLNIGDPRQVFDYILTTSETDRIKSFMKVFKRARNLCKESTPDEKIIKSVFVFFKSYLDQCDIKYSLYEAKYNKTISMIQQSKVDTKAESRDEIQDTKLVYTEETFYDMTNILNLIKKCTTKESIEYITLINTAKTICSINLEKIENLPQKTKDLYTSIINL
jgi:hypothetical protein